ncbi:MAG: pseudouridine synthase [Erysipelotrichales bacterium]
MIRLDKFLASQGFGSRKDVKKLVKDGLVEIDGEVVKKADFRFDENTSKVIVDEFEVEYRKNTYIIMNKPKGYVCANQDNLHSTVFELLVEFEHLDLFTIGRLDLDTTGLLLISDDGAFAHKLTSPKSNIKKEYHALISGFIKQKDIDYFNDGVIIDEDYKCLPAHLEVVEENEATSLIKIVISEGKFHQVKKMVKAIGYDVLELNRVRIGDLELDNSLESGEYCLIDEDVIKNIF